MTAVLTASDCTDHAPYARAAALARARLGALLARDRVPGVQHVVVSANDTLSRIAAGWADRASRVPFTNETPSLAYSLSKTVTAFVVLQLAEANTLDLDAPVSDWLPWQPYGEITPRQLLAHTAGVPNPLPLAWVHEPDVPFDEAGALRLAVTTHARRVEAPDTHVRYSNIGYWLLGALVEAATGQTFANAVQERITRPLALPGGALGVAPRIDTPVATGYVERHSLMWWLRRWLIDERWRGDADGRWGTMRPHRVNGIGYGGMVGTAAGFAGLLQELLKAMAHEPARTVGPRAVTWMSAPHRFVNGHSTAMALGWNLRWRSGRHGMERQLFKEGGGAGYHHLMRVYPQHGLASVLMSNATGLGVHQLLDELDAPFLAGS